MSSVVRAAQAQHAGAEGDLDVATERALAGAHGPRQHLDHPHVALQLGHAGVVHAPDADLGHQSGDGREAHAGLAQRREDLFDVAQEQRVRPHDEHALALQGEAVRVEQVGGPVQRHGRLAGPRPSLDHEDPGQGGTDDLVLLALDGADDVAHVARPGLSQGGQERAGPAQDQPVGEQPLPAAVPVRCASGPGRHGAPKRPSGSTKYSSSSPSTDRPRTARWRRRARPCGSRPVAR